MFPPFVVQRIGRELVVRRSRVRSLASGLVLWSYVTVPCVLLGSVLAASGIPTPAMVAVVASYAVFLTPFVVFAVPAVRARFAEALRADRLRLDVEGDRVLWNRAVVCRMADLARMEIIVDGRSTVFGQPMAHLYLVDRQQRRRVDLGTCALTEARALGSRLGHDLNLPIGVV